RTATSHATGTSTREPGTGTPATGDAIALVDEGGTPAALLDALRAQWHVDLVNSQRRARDEVNSGKAAFYVTGVLPGEQTPNAAQGLYAQPVGLFVPFTFRLEDVSLHQAEGILNGSIEDWSEVGGPEEAV